VVPTKVVTSKVHH